MGVRIHVQDSEEETVMLSLGSSMHLFGSRSRMSFSLNCLTNSGIVRS